MALERPLRIAIVAGELSGDLLGAGLIKELKKSLPDAQFIGIGGPQMLQQGFYSYYDMNKLSVMGITDVLCNYPTLWRIRQHLFNEWQHNPPDIFIGIDYSHFNLSLELRLKRKNIKTVHLVSPKIWAWRQKRIRYIKEAVDLMLTLFPFEASFYQQHNVPVQFIGHPLADLIDLNAETIGAQRHFNNIDSGQLIAVLPGSRMSEIKYMAPLFLDAMQEMTQREPQIKFIVPLANNKLGDFFKSYVQSKKLDLNVQIIIGETRKAISAADIVLVKSGTATLETMLLKKPMVVAFKWGKLTHAIIAPQLKVPYISLPNLLANKELVPELIQGKATAKNISNALLQLLHSTKKTELIAAFDKIHQTLARNADQQAALAVLSVLGFSQ